MLRPRVGPVPRVLRSGEMGTPSGGGDRAYLPVSQPLPMQPSLPCGLAVGTLQDTCARACAHVCTRVQVCMCLCLCVHACMCARGCMCASACVHTHAYSKPHNTLLSCVVFVACATFMFTMAHVASPVNPLRQAGITTALHTERGRDCVRL